MQRLAACVNLMRSMTSNKRGGPRDACRVDPTKRRKQPGVSLPCDLMDEIKDVAKALGIPTSRAYELALREWLLKRPGQEKPNPGDG